MIRGVGIDMVAVKRFEELSFEAEQSFYEKKFTVQEIGYCLKKANPAESFAGIFAAKEAYIKVKGLELENLSEIEVRHAPNGKPNLFYEGTLDESVCVSISHDGGMAVAVCCEIGDNIDNVA